MVEMNPYYAQPSSVGDVFDVANWSPRKSFGMGIVGAVLGVLLIASAILLWNPQLIVQLTPGLAAFLERETQSIAQQYLFAIPVIIFCLGAIAYVFIASGVGSVLDSFRSDFYFRAGPGGLSLRVPHGPDWRKGGFGSKVLNIDVPWDKIDRWRITQRKKLGSLSRDTGSLDAHLEIRIHGGRTYVFSLDGFREPARIIYERIQEALEMQTFVLTPVAGGSAGPAAKSVVGANKREAVSAALTELLAHGSNGAAVLFADETSGTFVQFLQLNGDLLLDLPLKSLSDERTVSAGDFFRTLSTRSASSEATVTTASVAPSVVITQHAYQVNLQQDVAQAADLTLEVFECVLGAPADFEMSVERC
jgi:hypothetical protein